MKKRMVAMVICCVLSVNLWAQQQAGQEEFWQRLQALCGKSFAGQLTTGPVAGFDQEYLQMYVMECSDTQIKIPFHVGENRSRTWIFTKTASGIELKHDHRMEDGSDDQTTMYGGTTTNSGFADMQLFPADQQTADLIPAASANVWWVTLNDDSYSYNLRKADSPKHFQVVFDLNHQIPTPQRPWGHEK